MNGIYQLFSFFLLIHLLKVSLVESALYGIQETLVQLFQISVCLCTSIFWISGAISARMIVLVCPLIANLRLQFKSMRKLLRFSLIPWQIHIRQANSKLEELLQFSIIPQITESAELILCYWELCSGFTHFVWLCIWRESDWQRSRIMW